MAGRIKSRMVSLVRAEDLFGELRREERKEEEKTVEVYKSKGLDLLIEKFKTKLNGGQLHLRPGDFTEKDLEIFPIMLNSFSSYTDIERISGGYINYCMKYLDTDNIKLITRGLKFKIDDLGFNNDKNIVIYGDVGIFLGEGMCGGEITVFGNTLGYAGHYMSGGVIRIKGNAFAVGYYSDGGEIHIEGDFYRKNIDRYYIVKAKIYHRGELIIP